MATLYGKVALGAFDSSFGFGLDSDEGAVCTATVSADATLVALQFGATAMSAAATMSVANAPVIGGRSAVSSSATLTSVATGTFTFVSAMSGSATMSVAGDAGRDLFGQADLGSGGAVLYTPTATETSLQTASSSTSWSDAATISASEFTGGEDYLILCSASVGNLASTSTLNNFKMIHGSTDFVGSNKVIESHNVSEPSDVYGYMTKFTQPATPEDIKFQFKGSNTQADSINLIAMPLGSLTENTDYFFNEDDDSSSPTMHGTTYRSYASVSFTPTNNNEDWLVIANPTVRIDSTASNYLYSIKHGTDDRPYFSHEGEDLGENSTTILSRVFTLSNASSQTLALQGKDDETGINDHYASRIFVLRLNAMRDYAFSWSAARQVHTQNTFKKVSSVSVTPTTSSKALLIGYVRHESVSENNNIKAKIEDNSYAKPTGADGLVNVARDLSDQRAAVRLAPTNFIGYKTHDIDLSVAVDWDTDSAVNTYDHSLCAVSFALAGVPAGAVLTANGSTVRLGATALTSSATLSINTIMTHTAASTISASATLTTGSIVSYNVPIVTGPAVVSAIGRLGVSGKVSCEASATVAGVARQGLRIQSDMSGSGAVSVAGKLTMLSSVAISGSSTLVTGAISEVAGAINMSASAILSTNNVLGVSGLGNLQSTANIAGKGVLSLRGIAPMSMSSVIPANGVIAVSVIDNDIVSITTYIDQSISTTLYIDEGITPSLYVDRELATSLER